MSYDFYVVNGKKLIDYKPKREHYVRALQRMIEDDVHFPLKRDKLIKYIYLNVKLLVSSREDELSYEQLRERLQFMFNLTDLIGQLTPGEFMQIFPIPKEYDGERYGSKDYFSTMQEVRKYPFGQPIGADKIIKFIMDYYNWDIMEFEVKKLSIISKIRRLDGQKGVMEEFLENQGIQLKTLHQEGDYLVDDKTGEWHKICKPKNPMRKLFSVATRDEY